MKYYISPHQWECQETPWLLYTCVYYTYCTGRSVSEQSDRSNDLRLVSSHTTLGSPADKLLWNRTKCSSEDFNSTNLIIRQTNTVLLICYNIRLCQNSQITVYDESLRFSNQIEKDTIN